MENLETIGQTVSLDEFKKQAYNAFRNTSFDPDKRANIIIKEYSECLISDLEKIKNATEEEKQKYIVGFKSKFSAWLNAKSRCASSMITAPANFPVERNRKANDSERKRGEEFYEYMKRSKNSILKNIENRRPQEEKDEERWNNIEKNLLSTIQTIIDIDEGRNTYSARQLFTSSLTGFINRMAKNGQIIDVNKSLDLIEKLNQVSKKPIITKKSKIWELRDKVKEVIEKKEEISNREDKEYFYEGFKVVLCYKDERIRIIHNEKPDRTVIDNIKKHGFRWSPFNKAWQRQITNNALYTTFKLLLKDFKQIN